MAAVSTATTAAPPVLVVVAVYIEAFRLAPLSTAVALLTPAAGWVAFAFATGADATDSIPANNAVTAVSATRFRSVDFDIFFLSLVRIKNFLTLARRSFDLLIPFPYGTHV
jgi:hypothetical protein